MLELRAYFTLGEDESAALVSSPWKRSSARRRLSRLIPVGSAT